jgi:hypothetical protein
MPPMPAMSVEVHSGLPGGDADHCRYATPAQLPLQVCSDAFTGRALGR